MSNFESSLTPSRPYLVRALYDWIIDNQCTPYVLVDATLQEVIVPEDYIANGQIILNISPTAVKDLFVDGKGLSFSARFGGVPMAVFVPTMAILAIYAKENGQGMAFGGEPGAPTPPTFDGGGSDGAESADAPERKKPSLKIVK